MTEVVGPTAVGSIILSLLKSADGHESFDTMRELDSLSALLLENLLKSKKTRESSTTMETGDFIRTTMAYDNRFTGECTLRDILGNLPSTMITKLAIVLADLMSQRVDPLENLPATQDVTANEEALTTTAITLTPQSFLAAKTYAELIAMPGSWGAGIIQVSSLSCLAALLKRWNVECCGNNSQTNDGSHDGDSTKVTSPIKSSRARIKRSRYDMIEDIEYSENNEQFDTGIDGASNKLVLTASELKHKGFDVCTSVAKIPFLDEFHCWSDEAVEVAIESSIYALMTVSAIASAGFKGTKSGQRTMYGDEIIMLLSTSLQACAVNSCVTENGEVDRPTSTYSSQQTSVYILRGLLPMITMQADVPNGQTGKQAARDVAVTTIEGIIHQLSQKCKSEDMVNLDDNGSRSVMKTPMTNRSIVQDNEIADCESSTPRTARKKKRVSFGTINGKRVNNLSPPILKACKTPLRSRSQQKNGPSQMNSNERPRFVLNAIVGLLQRLTAFKGLDRAAVRAQAVDAIMRCLYPLPEMERLCFLRFLIQLCHSKVAMHRLVGVELVGSCLSKVWFWKEHGDPKNTMSARTLDSPGKGAFRRGSLSPPVVPLDKSIPIALMGCLNGRLGDKAPAVRARAAYAVTEMIRAVKGNTESDHSEANCVYARFISAMRTIGGEILVSLRKRAALDVRATVRKGSIIALTEILLLGTLHEPSLRVSEIEIQLFAHLCMDDSVATRKAAAESITSILEMEASNRGPMTTPLGHSWTSSVLPLVLDNELTCVNTTLDCFYRVVLDPIVTRNGKNTNSFDMSIPYETAWALLAHINESSLREGATKCGYDALREALCKATETYGDTALIAFFNELRDVADRSLKNEVDSERSAMLRSACWCVLSALTDQTKELSIFNRWIKRKSVGFEFLTVSWKSMLNLRDSSSVSEESRVSLYSSMRSCLRVVARVSRHIEVEQIQGRSLGLIELIGSFSIGPDLIGAAISALVAITRRTYDPEQAMIACSIWVKGLYQRCEEVMSTFVTGTNKDDDEALVRAIFLTGELAMIGFKSDEDALSKRSKGNARESFYGFFEKPSHQLLSLGQTMLAKTLPRGDGATPEAARAHAFVTLGKLCLRDEAFAKQCLSLFARELHQSISETCVSVQSNALLVMGDLCVKYTNLVDKYLPVMAACLQAGVYDDSDTSFLTDVREDGAQLVRKHAVLLLSSLLLQDYIKWRGFMFHRFLVAAVDDDGEVAKLAEMTLCGPLLERFPKLFLNNFVESLFVLNRCTAHPIYMVAITSADSGSGIAVGLEGINLRNAAGRSRRMQMYKLMLSKMRDEDKLGVIARLAKDVLGAALDSTGDMGRVCRNPSLSCTPAKSCASFERDMSAASVLSDAFSILICPEIKVGRSSDNGNDKSLDDINKVTQITVAKESLMGKISRKQLIEIVLPIVCRLKSILQRSCSPLLKDLMRFMSETFRAYKTEVREFLANDPNLLQEVEYDAKHSRSNTHGNAVRQVIGSPRSVN